MKRKDFIWQLALASVAPVSFYCTPSNNKFTEDLTGPDSETGHLLRDGIRQSEGSLLQIDTLIVGAGISGLTAGYTLSKQGFNDFLIIELEKHAGGNSSFRENQVSAYPLGAHYLPIPNLNQPALISFLEDAGIITGFDDAKKPIYKDEYLCHEPEERLFIKNYWQEGLVPDYSVLEDDKKQIARFFKRMKSYQMSVGKDGKEAFCIPIMQSSLDEEFRQLDKISFKDFLIQNNFDSEYLHWYIDYCLRDDFGTKYEETSAWMGIHYFASRKGISSNADANDVLTWPEGNGKLAEELRRKITDKIDCQKMAINIETDKNKHRINYYDSANKKYGTIACNNLILAVPQFICNKILPKNITHPIEEKLEYSPWLIANLTVKQFVEQGRGAVLSWDNVIYGSKGLGYVNACHQHLKVLHDKLVLTYYRPMLDKSPEKERKSIRNFTTEDWKKIVIDDLKIAHPTIEDYLLNIEIFVTGHSMPQPKIGLVNKVFAQRENHVNGIYFCHSDLSGYSIFEEAFYWGHKAAEQIIKNRS